MGGPEFRVICFIAAINNSAPEIEIGLVLRPQDSGYYLQLLEVQQFIIGTGKCSVVQCSAVPCRAMPCSAVKCSAVQCSVVYCSAVQCSAVQCCVVQCRAVQCKGCRTYFVAGFRLSKSKIGCQSVISKTCQKCLMQYGFFILHYCCFVF